MISVIFCPFGRKVCPNDKVLTEFWASLPVAKIYTELVNILSQDALDQGRLTDYDFEKAASWIQDCRSNHKDMCSDSKTDFLPTRLVEVALDGDKITARLRHRTMIQSGTEYLTLSHCWGNSEFYTLTEQNVDSMTNSIPVDKLPPVFVDALYVTTQLGHSYIWIDSLCIIQGGSENCHGSDWAMEGSMMDSIYGNSICNLAATGFADGQSSLFAPPTLRERLPPKIQCHSRKSNSGMRNYFLADARDWMTNIKLGPLHSRAWVWQEQMLVRLNIISCEVG